MQKKNTLIPELITFFIIAVSLGVTFAIYRNGLYSPFLFDDYSNLKPINRYLSFSFLDQIIIFITHGGKTLLNRPVSLLSFYINYPSWASDPYAFKYTNLMIHLLNGLLLFWLTHKLLFLFKPSIDTRKNLLIAGFCMLLWLAHPINVSTVIYVIQRMTQLSALFMLAALIAYTYGRGFLNDGKIIKGYATLISGISIFGILGILSKENAVLLPLFILIIEFTLLSSNQLPSTRLSSTKSLLPKGYRTFILAYLILPVLLLITYIIINKETYVLNAYDMRDFSLYERLLTESRVLVDYLKLLVIPDISGTGIFHDDYTISRGILNPVSTLFSVLFILAAIIFPFIARKKYPMLSFAMLWFFAGHLLESGIFGLEIYFEHRNYFPIIGIIFAAAYSLISYEGKIKKLITIFSVFFLVALPVLTYLNTFAWAHFKQLAPVWAIEHPGSHRAAVTAIQYMPYQGKNHNNAILQIYEKAYRAAPRDVGRILQRMAFKCSTKTITQDDITETIASLKQAYYSNTISKYIDILSTLYKDNGCPPLNKKYLYEIIQTLIKIGPVNTKDASTQWKIALHKLYRRLAMMEMDDQQFLAAIEYLDIANKIISFPPSLLMQAEWLANNDQYTEALKYITKAEQTAEKEVLPYLPNPYIPEIKRIKDNIRSGTQTSGRELRLKKKSKIDSGTKIEND